MPDPKTIADFRKDHADALRQLCRTFILLCKALELFGGEGVAMRGQQVSGHQPPPPPLLPGETQVWAN